MSFVNYINEEMDKNIVSEVTTVPKPNGSSTPKEEPEEILRRNDFKIKLVINTLFGKQIDFAKKYDMEKVKEVLQGFNIKLRDKSVFILDKAG